MSDSVSSARACWAVMATLVTVLSDSAAVSLALRLAVVEIVSAVPTHTTMTRIPSALTTRPGLIRRLVRRASQRWGKAAKKKRGGGGRGGRGGGAGEVRG